MFNRIVRLYGDAYAGLPRGAWLLALSEFINRCGFMVLVFLNIYLTRRLGFTLLQAGRILAAFGVGSLVGGYLGGSLCDKIGPMRILVGSLVLSGGLLIGTAYVTGYKALLVLLFLYGITATALFPASDTAMTRFCFGEMRTKGFALRRLAANLGITFGPVIGGYLILLDYRWLFWVDGLTTLASAVVVLVFIKTISPAAGAATPSADGSAPAPAPVPAPTRSPWRDGPYLAFLGFMLILATVFAQLFSTFNLYLNNVYGLPESRIGPLWAVNTILIVLVEMVLLHALRRVREMPVIALGSVLIGAGFALLPFGRGMFFAAGTVVIWTMGEILTMPFTATVASARSGGSTGRYMGLLSLVFSLSMLIAPLAGNWLYETGGGTKLWLLAGAASAVSAAGFWLLRKPLSVPKPAR